MFTNPAISCTPSSCTLDPPLAFDHAGPKRRPMDVAGSTIRSMFSTAARSITGFIPHAGDRSISEATLDSVERDRRLR